MSIDVTILNRNNDNNYSILPFEKRVEKSQNSEKNKFMDYMNNFNDLRMADKNKDNILSLNELKDFDQKSDFMQSLLIKMEEFAKIYK